MVYKYKKSSSPKGKDKAYIINQILAYGDIKDLKWLFKAYSNQVIKNVFLKKPIKIYRPQAYNFAKNILLEIDKPLNQNYYVINTPKLLDKNRQKIFKKLSVFNKEAVLGGGTSLSLQLAHRHSYDFNLFFPRQI